MNSSGSASTWLRHRDLYYLLSVIQFSINKIIIFDSSTVVVVVVVISSREKTKRLIIIIELLVNKRLRTLSPLCYSQ